MALIAGGAWLGAATVWAETPRTLTPAPTARSIFADDASRRAVSIRFGEVREEGAAAAPTSTLAPPPVDAATPAAAGRDFAATPATLDSNLAPAAVRQASAEIPAQSPSGHILRWRARHPDSFTLNDQRQVEPTVRQVSHTQGDDAFRNPFGDRGGPANGPDTDPLRQLDPPMPLAPPTGPSAPPGLEPRVRPSPLADMQRRPTPACDKVYNDRDCCDESEKCRTAQEIVQQYTIDRISLNITPLFKPDLDAAARAAAKSETLFQAKRRQWTNRDGVVVAEGLMADFLNERVFIVLDDGTTVKYPLRELSDDDRCFVSAWWGLPVACTLGDQDFANRQFAPLTFTWTASQSCHKPLYFEERGLERYGHTAGPFVQPWLSGAHFFANIAILPYRIGINPLNECQYDLGYYRPGNCAPWLVPPVPLSPRGALLQGAVVTGAAFVIP